MREMLNIHIGQFGINLADQLWNQLYYEDIAASEQQFLPPVISSPLYSINDKNQFQANAILCDLDDEAIRKVQKNDVYSIFGEDSIVYNIEGSGGLSTRAKYNTCRDLEKQLRELIRHKTEKIDYYEGSIMYFSPCGGTGSGLTNVVKDSLYDTDNKAKNIAFQLFPSQNVADSIVEPYNFMFSSSLLLERIDLSIFVTNENASQILKLNRGIEMPKHEEVNRLYVEFLSNLTSSARYFGDTSSNRFSLDRLCQQQKPYPSIKSFSPSHYIQNEQQQLFNSTDYAQRQLINTNNFNLGYYQNSKDSEIEQRIIDISTFTRGSINKLSIIKEYNCLFQNVNSNIVPKLADQKSFSYYFSSQRAPKYYRDVSSDLQEDTHSSTSYLPSQEKFNFSTLSTSSNVITVLQGIADKFDKLYEKKAFIHYFVGEGMESGEASETRELLQQMISDYEEVSKLEQIDIDN
ncbi:tubulin alpha chain [Stylonychia lemnae]|uniref:Tubulin alpha chain n=1 Tax=Stylonychia lemnae TaxID=5949 RepID=A0A078B634_STYLE|nr:tubulin alpha chain [Stylonychia lemnae]|eukprot:CDW88772.1 tubulin alpha chain [Stylonychia lemnae]